jgi:POT family proton-dependent oligopeptide transporter
MGVWFLSNFAANLLGGLIASQVDKIATGKISMPWDIGGKANFFMLFLVSSVGAGVLMLILTPLTKKMLHGRG